jgi:hypothetical protein
LYRFFQIEGVLTVLLSKIVADQVRSRVFIPSTPLLNILQLPFHSQPTSVWAFLAAFCQSRVPPSETASTTTNLNAPPTNSNLNASPIASVAKDAALAARSIAESSASVLRKFFFFFFFTLLWESFFSLFVVCDLSSSSFCGDICDFSQIRQRTDCSLQTTLHNHVEHVS